MSIRWESEFEKQAEEIRVGIKKAKDSGRTSHTFIICNAHMLFPRWIKARLEEEGHSVRNSVLSSDRVKIRVNFG